MRLSERYGCLECENVYPSRYSLKRHVESIHLGLRKYKCDRCDKRFTQKKSKDEHMNSHTHQRPYCCELCGQSYQNRQSLYKHKQGCFDASGSSENELEDIENKFIGDILEEKKIIPPAKLAKIVLPSPVCQGFSSWIVEKRFKQFVRNLETNFEHQPEMLPCRTVLRTLESKFVIFEDNFGKKR